MTDFGDNAEVVIDEDIILEKFEGEPRPENLIERVHLHNGEILRHEFIENGQVVRVVEKGGEDAAN